MAMAAIEPLCSVMKINSNVLSREENWIVEAELFMRLYTGLIDFFKTLNQDYFRLFKFNSEMENNMLEVNFLRHIIKDILLSQEYSLEGIALYTQSSEEVICDLVTGKNTEPSLPLSRKIIDLHRTVRPKLYREIMKKITAEYLKEEFLTDTD